MEAGLLQQEIDGLLTSDDLLTTEAGLISCLLKLVCQFEFDYNRHLLMFREFPIQIASAADSRACPVTEAGV